MSRIGERFRRLREERRKGFVGFVTAGDPSLERTVELAGEMEKAGVDVLELGVPFSDPLEAVRRIRKTSDLPLLLFSYFNPLLRFGLPALAREAAAAGVDGVLVTDLPPEEAGGWLEVARDAGLDTVFLAAPTSPDERLRRVAGASRGFVYAISRTGVTGERDALSDDARPLLSRIKALTREPVALGFGISTPEQVAAAASVADAVVVGSALVRFLEEHPDGDVAGQVRWLTRAI